MKKHFILWLALSLTLVFSASLFAQKNQVQIVNNEIRIEYEGEITLNEEGTDIQSISDRGYFRYRDKQARKEIYIRSNARGELTKEYFIRGKEQPYEPEGRLFFQKILPKLIRESGLGAEQRVKSIYQKTGLSGVLTEIGQIDSDYVKGKYFNYLLEDRSFEDQELARILDQISKQIDSDYEQTKLLVRYRAQFLSNAQTTTAYLQSAQQIDSDYEKSKILRQALEQKDLSASQMSEILKVAAGFDSDYEKAKVIKVLLEERTLSDEQLNLALKATENIDSDYEKSKLLKKILEKNSLNEAQITQAIQAVAQIDSDYEKSKMLIGMTSAGRLSADQTQLVIQMAARIDSDYEKAKVIRNLLETNRPSTATINQILKIIPDVDSDHEKGRLLLMLADHIPTDDDALKQAFREAAKTIDSDYEYGKVMRTLED